MNNITIVLWITIALIAIIAIILVKLHYKSDELENDEGSILPSSESINNALNAGKNTLSSLGQNEKKPSNAPRSLSPQTSQQKHGASNLFRREEQVAPRNDAYIVPEVEVVPQTSFEYESENQVLINYDNSVKKFQEPIKQSQMDIMTQNNKDKTELKDLFTIDELIKESKRKDSEREKESKTINKEEDDAELTEIKESIKNKTEEPLIEEIINEEKEEEKISDVIKETTEEPLIASQKEVDEAISSAAEETEKVESTADDDITEVLLNQEAEEEKIEEPQLKTPSKVDEPETPAEDDVMDLDYRKDLDKFANKIKGSKIFQEVKDKLVQEPEEIPEIEDNETFIRNVNEYDPYEPIYNDRYIDADADYEKLHEIDDDERLRQQNTRRVFNLAKNSPEPELARPKATEIKSKPARDNIKIEINNSEAVLKKGDEIIFTHLGETYSSQVYAINGDDISVKYRRQNITIKPSDVKKIY